MATPKAVKLVYVASFVLHVGGGAALASIEVRRPPEPVVVEMRTIERRPPRPATPPPPEPEATPEPAPDAPRPRRVAAPAPAEAPPPAAEAPPPAAPPPDFGIALSGASSGPGGVAVPVGSPGGVPGGRPGGTGPVRQAARTLEARAPEAAEGGCAEDESRPRPLSMPRPAYTEEARQAAIEGRVRIELSIDATGHITSARVVSPLGYGLDDAALSAVRDATFTPASRCGEAIASTFVLAVRFTL